MDLFVNVCVIVYEYLVSCAVSVSVLCFLNNPKTCANMFNKSGH